MQPPGLIVGWLCGGVHRWGRRTPWPPLPPLVPSLLSSLVEINLKFWWGSFLKVGRLSEDAHVFSLRAQLWRRGERPGITKTFNLEGSTHQNFKLILSRVVRAAAVFFFFGSRLKVTKHLMLKSCPSHERRRHYAINWPSWSAWPGNAMTVCLCNCFLISLTRYSCALTRTCCIYTYIWKYSHRVRPQMRVWYNCLSLVYLINCRYWLEDHWSHCICKLEGKIGLGPVQIDNCASNCLARK